MQVRYLVVMVLALSMLSADCFGEPAALGEMEYSAYANVYLKAGPASIEDNAGRLKRLYVPAYEIVGNVGGPQRGAFIKDNYYYKAEWKEAVKRLQAKGGTKTIALVVNEMVTGTGDPDKAVLDCLLKDPRWGTFAQNSLLLRARRDGFKAVGCELRGVWKELAPAYTRWFAQFSREARRQGLEAFIVLEPHCQGCPFTQMIAAMEEPVALAAAADGILVQYRHFPRPSVGMETEPGASLMDPASGISKNLTFLEGELNFGLAHYPATRTEFSVEAGGSSWVEDERHHSHSEWVDWPTWKKVADKEGGQVLRKFDGGLFVRTGYGDFAYNDASYDVERIKVIQSKGFKRVCLMSLGNEEPRLWKSLPK